MENDKNNVAGETGTKPTYEEVMAMLEAEQAKNAAYETEKAERLHRVNLKTKIARHDYGTQAIQILVKRNLTEGQQDELAPPETVERFLVIYDLKKAAGKTHIYVLDRELNKCQSLVAEGKPLEEITLKDLEEEKKKSNTTETQGEDSEEDSTTDETNQNEKPEVVGPDEG
jgi:hypothetical protein